MENKNIYLGKLNKDKCYVNDGKYGYFLTCDKKNYKIPEWLSHEKMDLATAEKFIAYKDKMGKLYSCNSDIEKAENSTKQSSEEEKDDDEVSTEEEHTEIDLTKTKK